MPNKVFEGTHVVRGNMARWGREGAGREVGRRLGGKSGVRGKGKFFGENP